MRVGERIRSKVVDVFVVDQLDAGWVEVEDEDSKIFCPALEGR